MNCFPNPFLFQPLNRTQIAKRNRSSINMKNFKKFNARRKWKVGVCLLNSIAVGFVSMVKESRYWLECVSCRHPQTRKLLPLPVSHCMHVFLCPSVILCPSCTINYLVIQPHVVPKHFFSINKYKIICKGIHLNSTVVLSVRGSIKAPLK